MINSDQAKKLSEDAENETAIDSPRLDEASRFKVAGILRGFNKLALLNSDQVERLAQNAKMRSPVTLSNPRLDANQQVGHGSGAVQ